MNEDLVTPRRVYRSRRDRMIAGVAGGLGQYFNVDPVLVRLGFALLGLTTGIGIVAYVVLAIVMPERPLSEAEPALSAPAGLRGSHEVVGFALVGLGLLLLTSNMGIFNALRWDLFWPLVLIAVGAFLLVNRARNS